MKSEIKVKMHVGSETPKENGWYFVIFDNGMMMTEWFSEGKWLTEHGIYVWFEMPCQIEIMRKGLLNIYQYAEELRDTEDLKREDMGCL